MFLRKYRYIDNSRFFLLYFLLLLTRIYPTSFINVRIIDFGILLLSFDLIYRNKNNQVLFILKTKTFFLLSLFSFFVTLSLFNSIWYLEQNIRSVFEMTRYFSFLIYFYIGVLAGYNFNYNFNLLKSFFKFLFSIIIVFSLLQIFIPHQINFITLLWSSLKNADAVFDKRIVSFYFNPNSFAVFLIIFIFISLQFKEKFFKLSVILFFIFLLYTGSRTALLALFMVSFIYYISINKIFSVTNIYKMGFIVFVILVIDNFYIFPYIKNNLPYLWDMVSKILNNGIEGVFLVHSMQLRLELWSHLFEIFKVHWLLGIGPARNVIGSVADNQYIYFLVHYGIIGLFVFLYFVFNILWISKKDLNNLDDTIRFLARIVYITYITLLITSFTGENFIDIQISYWYLTITGLYLGIKRKRIWKNIKFVI